MSRKNEKKPKDGDLRVWWIPQIPGQPFLVNVRTLREARLLTGALAEYDKFQFDHNVKPDYSNAGGVQVFEHKEFVDFWTEDGIEFDKLTDAQIDELDKQRLRGNFFNEADFDNMRSANDAKARREGGRP
jgi:hypothetical protein